MNGIRDLSFWPVLLRLVLATICGAAVGLERSYKNRPAGFRTHILVCLGAAVADMTGMCFYLYAGFPSDPARIGAQVVAGLGFIGAGTIIVTKKSTVKGLTTAAGLWTTGVAGLAIGSGFYEGGILLTLLILIIETGFQVFDPKKIKRQAEFKLVIYYEEKGSLDHVMRYLKNNRIAITNL